MLNVLCIVDKEDTALDRLAQVVKPYHKNINYNVLAVHPKRPDEDQIRKFIELSWQADVIDYQYFRTAEMLRAKFPEISSKPSILTHNNPYSITEGNWNDYQVSVGNNQYITERLHDITSSRVEKIPIVTDPYFWKYNDNYKGERSVIMVANRIESKKGILPVAEACKQLNIPMYLVGAISDMEYFNKVIATGVVRFAQQVPDEKLRELYYKAGLHVCNSIDNFESGTMPVLESMFCGLPVLSRLVGHVPEIKDNIFINEGDTEDIENLANLIREALSDKNRLERMRSQAWFDIKDRIPERRAYMYQRLYREVLPGTPVSIVLPVADKPELTRQNLDHIANQTHSNIEVIVIDNGTESQQEVINEFATMVSSPVRYIRLPEPEYMLAKARNIGIIEATSDIIVFCDQRMAMDSTAVEVFLQNIKPKYWLYGDKGVKKDFVENFSCIYRDDIINMGMFNERITKYGGMSQEVRSRARKQGYSLEYTENAKATPLGKSSNRNRKRYEIMEMKTQLWKKGQA